MPDSSDLDHHYRVLGVGRNATPDDIEAAFRRVVMNRKDGHPDKGGTSDSFIEADKARKALLAAIHGRSDQQRGSAQPRQEPVQQTGSTPAPRRQQGQQEPRSRRERESQPRRRAQQDQRGRQRREPAPGPSAREAPTQPPHSPPGPRQPQPRNPSGGPRPPTARERREQEARERREREEQERREREARERREREEQERREREEQERREREERERREREEQERREEEERSAVARVKRRLRVAALLLASGAMAASVACDFLGINVPGVPLSFTIFPAIAMLGGILFVATLPSPDNMDVRFLIPGAMVGYVLATGYLDEIYIINPFRADESSEVRTILAFPALVIDAQVDAYSHRYGSIPAICVGVIIAGFWRLGLERRAKGMIRPRVSPAGEEKPEKSRNLPPLAELGNTALWIFGNSMLTAPVSYAVLHTALLLAFLIIVGIPFAIVDIFIDISMTQISEGDLWHLWIVAITSFAALACGRSIGRVPRLMDDLLHRIMQGGNRVRDRLVGTAFLAFALLPSAAMFGLIALVGLYWEPVLLPLIEWAY